MFVGFIFHSRTISRPAERSPRTASRAGSYADSFISVSARFNQYVTPWPELYGWGVGAEDLKYRFNWTFPIHWSRHDPGVLWVCSQHVHRSTDVGASWEVLSADL